MLTCVCMGEEGRYFILRMLAIQKSVEPFVPGLGSEPCTLPRDICILNSNCASLLSLSKAGLVIASSFKLN